MRTGWGDGETDMGIGEGQVVIVVLRDKIVEVGYYQEWWSRGLGHVDCRNGEGRDGGTTA